jgi:hypothetical protein
MAGLSRRHRLAEHRLWINERAIDGIESLKTFVARLAKPTARFCQPHIGTARVIRASDCSRPRIARQS